MRAPLYLNQAAPGKSTRLVLNEQGTPVYQGTMPATFEILIPHSVVGANAKSARVVQYGHGLFGDKSEVEVSYLAEDADRSVCRRCISSLFWLPLFWPGQTLQSLLLIAEAAV